MFSCLLCCLLCLQFAFCEGTSPVISINRRTPVQNASLVVTCTFNESIKEPARFYKTPSDMLGECSTSHSCDSGVSGYSLSLDTSGKVMKLTIASVNRARDSGMWYCVDGGNTKSNIITLSLFTTILDWNDIEFAPPLSSLPTKLSLADSFTVSATTPCVEPTATVTFRYQKKVTGVPGSCTFSTEETCPPGLSRTISNLTLHTSELFTSQITLTVTIEHDSFDPPNYIRSLTLPSILLLDKTHVVRIPIRGGCCHTFECKENNSVCYRGICLCTPGYIYSPKTGKCNKNCARYGSSMTPYKGLAIKKHNNKVISAEPRECVKACINEKSFVCRSADSSVKSDCHLSEYGYIDVDPDDREQGYERWTLYMRNCAP